jgi:hypothetical protein
VRIKLRGKSSELESDRTGGSSRVRGEREAPAVPPFLARNSLRDSLLSLEKVPDGKTPRGELARRDEFAPANGWVDLAAGGLGADLIGLAFAADDGFDLAVHFGPRDCTGRARREIRG